MFCCKYPPGEYVYSLHSFETRFRLERLPGEGIEPAEPKVRVRSLCSI